ncbi:MAG: hypothetical protein MI975_24540 [Cytophagales bacterium]|nr:hypothetical protein [Cytophagales bacterium]
MRRSIIVIIGCVLILLLFTLDMTLGSVSIPLEDIILALKGGETKKKLEEIFIEVEE